MPSARGLASAMTKETVEADIREIAAKKTTTLLLLTFIVGLEIFGQQIRNFVVPIPSKSKEAECQTKMEIDAVQCQC